MRRASFKQEFVKTEKKSEFESPKEIKNNSTPKNKILLNSSSKKSPLKKLLF